MAISVFFSFFKMRALGVNCAADALLHNSRNDSFDPPERRSVYTDYTFKAKLLLFFLFASCFLKLLISYSISFFNFFLIYRFFTWEFNLIKSFFYFFIMGIYLGKNLISFIKFILFDSISLNIFYSI